MKNNYVTEVYSGVQLESDLLLSKVHDAIETELSIKAGVGSSLAHKMNKVKETKPNSTNQ